MQMTIAWMVRNTYYLDTDGEEKIDETPWHIVFDPKELDKWVETKKIAIIEVLEE